MSLKENLALIRARYEAVNAHDWKRLQGLYADSILWNDSCLDQPIKGSLAVRRRFEAFARGFP
ncbi:MAG: nuclear transport factor 2 family protein, partial [Nitrososphaerales archaeon]